jgi:CO/xanthine dehydrogenase FAD-binding subunit
VTVLAPDRLDDALVALAGDPSLTVLAGGTDLMVEVNYGRRRPEDVLSLRRLPELRRWHVEPRAGGGDEAVLGATVTYSDMLRPELAALLPGLAQAARTVGSPQIRNTGTLGGNLVTGSPAGDTLPVLVALDATVELAARTGRRCMAVREFLVGPKRTARRPDELVVAVRVPVAGGNHEFLKIGVRNAMVIAVASCSLVVDRERRAVACALGSVGPGPVRDHEAERWVTTRLDWDRDGAPHPSVVEGFGRRMAAASRPIDDHRATAAYRRQAVGVLARRALERAWGGGAGSAAA